MPIPIQRSLTTITLRRGDDTDFLGAAIVLRFSFPKDTVTQEVAEDCTAVFQVDTVAKPLTLVESAHTATHWVYTASLVFAKVDTLRLTPGPHRGWLKIIHDDPNVAGTGKSETSTNAVDFLVLQQEVRP